MSKGRAIFSLIVSLAVVGANSGTVFAELKQDSVAIPNYIAQRLRNCSHPGSNAEYKECIRLRYEAADRRLNQVYQQLVAKLNRKQRSVLYQEQIKWIKSRDKNCELEVYDNRGGTGYNGFLNECLERKTKQRTAELENYLRKR
ncbi:lysozyme inhibitor LprI family protein [Lyngbya sp. CCAP 1446/10]|uniref:lysozyme inhibitor LprI family protein n=1 Tax=Lyngbya sp. CCAP 1446/10 TaxID=439293 RepID=UPI002238A80A|nr:lysozyme inhibitor LprI family protein [Lyngbya sp. CCAP 1446/10]MCW6051368.1 lysozyme inhibitor LprI family protein [Lyngbya sp. CCAP 1446/10]